MNKIKGQYRQESIEGRSGVYLISNSIDNKVYVGSSINILSRIDTHKKALQTNSHKNRFLQRAWNKHTENAFDFKVLEYCDQEELLGLEQFYINFYCAANPKNGYNLCPKAYSVVGVKHSKKAKLNRSKSQKEYFKNNPEERLVFIATGQKYCHSKKARLKKSKSLSKYVSNGRTEAHIKNLKKAQQEAQNRPKVRLKKSLALLGKKLPKHQKLKIRKAVNKFSYRKESAGKRGTKPFKVYKNGKDLGIFYIKNDAAKKFGLSAGTVGNYLNGKTDSVLGYKMEYIHD